VAVTVILAISGLGSVAEYAMYYVVPQLRARYPLLGGRLVPYLMGGVGATYFEVKDVKPRGFDLRLDGKNFSVAGLLGGGVDYLVARNIAVGLEVEYLISRGNSASINGNSQSLTLDALLMTAGVRVFFGKGTAQ
jgi:opacity protein-like surface antigen